MMKIYLSPHLDDAVFSCGGIIHEQVKSGDHIEVWTFATREADVAQISPYAQSLHLRWGDVKHPVRMRREEDEKALTLLGCQWKHLDFLDCIYLVNTRTGEPLIKTDQDLFLAAQEKEPLLVDEMIRSMKELLGLRLNEDIEIIAPLAVGGHIDHCNTRLAAEKLGLPLTYYADFPYAAQDPSAVEASLPVGTNPLGYHVSDRGLTAWQKSIACYQSQISSFWNSTKEMEKALLEYAALPIACTLWKLSSQE